MKSKVILNSAYLWKKAFQMGVITGLITYILRLDFDTLFDANYLIKHLFSVFLFAFVWGGVMYLIYFLYYFKRVEAIEFSPKEGETILEEKMVSYGESMWKIYFGKLYKTSHRVVFIAPKRIFTKENYFEISLEDISIEEKKRTFWGNFFQIISIQNKKYRFEVYS